MQAYGGIETYIQAYLDLGTRWICQLHAPTVSFPVKNFQVPIEKELDGSRRSSGCGGDNRRCLCGGSRRQIFKPSCRSENNIKTDMREGWIKAWAVFVRRITVKRSKNLQVKLKLKYLNSWISIILLYKSLLDRGRKLHISVSCFLEFFESGHTSDGYWQSFVWIL